MDCQNYIFILIALEIFPLKTFSNYETLINNICVPSNLELFNRNSKDKVTTFRPPFSDYTLDTS